jgi:hypothetical protein
MARPVFDSSKINKANWDLTVPTPWNNAGGDWWDSTVTAQGTSAWASEPVADTDTPRDIAFDVTTLMQAIHDNANHPSAIIVRGTSSALTTFRQKSDATAAFRPRIAYDGGAAQECSGSTGLSGGSAAGFPSTSPVEVSLTGTGGSTYSNLLVDLPPPATRPTSATLTLYSEGQFTTQTIQIFWLRYPPQSAPSLVTYTYARPASDITTQWSPSTGTAHFALIDETTANDADYIYATAAGQTDEVRLASMTAPQAGTDLLINYKVAGIVGSASVTMSLRQGSGGTLIATDTAKTSDNTYQLVVPAATWASVTDWTDLRLRFVSA